jgi:hypothetical protein
MHSQGYFFENPTNKYTNFIPLNIERLLSPIGLAYWILGEGIDLIVLYSYALTVWNNMK